MLRTVFYVLGAVQHDKCVCVCVCVCVSLVLEAFFEHRLGIHEFLEVGHVDFTQVL